MSSARCLPALQRLSRDGVCCLQERNAPLRVAVLVGRGLSTASISVELIEGGRPCSLASVDNEEGEVLFVE